MSVSGGVDRLGLLPYGDTCQRSVAQAHADTSDSVPIKTVFSPAWACLGSQWAMACASGESRQVPYRAVFLSTAVRNFCARRIRDKTLKCHDVFVVDPDSSTTAVPVYDVSKSVQTCPAVAESSNCGRTSSIWWSRVSNPPQARQPSSKPLKSTTRSSIRAGAVQSWDQAACPGEHRT